MDERMQERKKEGKWERITTERDIAIERKIQRVRERASCTQSRQTEQHIERDRDRDRLTLTYIYTNRYTDR